MVVNIDDVFKDIGELGWQQVKYTSILCVLNVYGAFHMLQYAFVGYSVPFKCHTDDQNTPYIDECPNFKAEECADIEFPEEDQESTIVSEWSLVCDQSVYSDRTMSSFMFGVLLGAFFLGIMSDKIGRRKTLLTCLASMIIVNGLTSMMSSYRTYVFFRFWDGFFLGGYVIADFVLCNELIGASKSINKHWRSLTFWTSVFGFPLFLLTVLVPESPRWLQSQGRMHEALGILQYIATKNGKYLDEKKVVLSQDDDHVKRSNKTNFSHDSLWDLLKTWPLLKITLIQIYSWFINSWCYYALTLWSSQSKSSDSKYWSTAMSGLVEIPSYVLTTTLLTYGFGRRTTICLYMLISGGVLLQLFILKTDFMTESYVGNMVTVSKFCIAASFALIYIHSSEIFPTSIRNTAMGVVAVAARFGGMVAPQAAKPSLDGSHRELFFIGSGTLIAGIFNFFLPETRDETLPESIDDLKEMIGSHKKPIDHKGYKKLAIDPAEEDQEEV